MFVTVDSKYVVPSKPEAYILCPYHSRPLQTAVPRDSDEMYYLDLIWMHPNFDQSISSMRTKTILDVMYMDEAESPLRFLPVHSLNSLF